MDIAAIWMSQKGLRRADQINAIIGALLNGMPVPPVVLNRCEDGEVQVEDGHHRLAAIWLSGRSILYEWEYIVVDKDQWRPRYGRINDLLSRANLLIYPSIIKG